MHEEEKEFVIRIENETQEEDRDTITVYRCGKGFKIIADFPTDQKRGFVKYTEDKYAIQSGGLIELITKGQSITDSDLACCRWGVEYPFAWEIPPHDGRPAVVVCSRVFHGYILVDLVQAEDGSGPMKFEDAESAYKWIEAKNAEPYESTDGNEIGRPVYNVWEDQTNHILGA